MTFSDFQGLCDQRRSVRYFDAEPVSQKDIMALLEIAHKAPSVQNIQPWHFHVILDKDMRKKIMEASCYGNFVEGAGAFVVVTCNTNLRSAAAETVWNERELEYSCMSAMDHILLGATAMGLGSCWVSLHHGAANELLKLPAGHRIMGGIMLGHYKKGEEQSSGEHERRPLKNMVTIHP